MSLMSVREKLNNAALEDGASKEDLLRAALAASNDRYEKAVQEQNARLDRLEAAVRASNDKVRVDVSEQLKNAATDALKPMTDDLTEMFKRQEKNLNGSIAVASFSYWVLIVLLVVFVGGLVYNGYMLRESSRQQQRILWNVTYPEQKMGIDESSSDIDARFENERLYQRSEKERIKKEQQKQQ